MWVGGFLRPCGMNAWFQWVIAPAEKGQKDQSWVGSSERAPLNTSRHAFLMPSAGLWQASPVGQKENWACRLPPAALIQWIRAAWGGGGADVFKLARDAGKCLLFTPVDIKLHHLLLKTHTSAIHKALITHVLLLCYRSKAAAALTPSGFFLFFTCVSVLHVS